ncbi:MAG: TldD/PmbA family protein [Candidatus Hodarchaeales archaeon]|jgi:TldD protein
MLDELQKAVTTGEQLGATFVEARYDDLMLRTLMRTKDTWTDIIVKTRSGIGITCYQDGVPGYAFTANTDSKSIVGTVKKAVKLAKASVLSATMKLVFDELPLVKSTGSDSSARFIKKHPEKESVDYKIDLVNRAVETATEHGKNISNIRSGYGELYGAKLFTNSEGSIVNWDFEVIDLFCTVISKTEDGQLVIGTEQGGGTVGFELFENLLKSPEEIGKKAAMFAKEQLMAKACPAGKFRAFIDDKLAGVLAHESFGHSAEADFVVTGASALVGKVGQQLGSEHVSVIDSGRPDIKKNGGLWIPFDDQGISGGDTVIMEQGILKHYLHNRGTAKNMNQKPTGNCRAVHFGFIPIHRMTNTYFTPGDLSEEEALEKLDTGVYAIQTAGGQVDPSIGSFLFKAIRGYWIENGEKKHPLREVSLSGNILDLLSKVEGGTKNYHLNAGYFGGCGKGGQSPLPTGIGGPNLVISEVIFGGKV